MFSCISGKKNKQKHNKQDPLGDYSTVMDQNLDLTLKISGKTTLPPKLRRPIATLKIETCPSSPQSPKFHSPHPQLHLAYKQTPLLFKGTIIQDQPFDEYFAEFEVQCREQSQFELELLPLESSVRRGEFQEVIGRESEEASLREVKEGSLGNGLEESEGKTQETEEELSKDSSDNLPINDRFSKTLIKGDLQKSLKIFQKMPLPLQQSPDTLGFTPISLTCLLTLTNPLYLQFCKTLLYHSDLKLKSPSPLGWTPIQQAIYHKNIPLVVNIFRASYLKKRGELRCVKLPRFLGVLQDMRDFNLQIDAKVNSFIPLVERLAPSDSMRLFKVGSRVRLDSTLAGYEGFRCKRRELSLVFNPQGGSRGLQEEEVFPLYLMNKTKGTYTNVLQSLDEQQMRLIIKDLLQSQCISADPKIDTFKLTPSTNLFGSEIFETLGGYKTQKFDLSVNYQSRTQKRKQLQKGKQLVDLEFLSSWEQYNQRKDFNRKKFKKKSMGLSVWLSKEFPFDFKQFVEIVRTLGFGNKMLEKVANFFENKDVEELMTGFPVKIQIPLNFTLYVDIQFSKFTTKIQSTQKLFEIPANLQYLSRKLSQKTLQRQTKRLLLANLYL